MYYWQTIKQYIVVHDGIDREHKFCDVVIVKLPHVIFILFATYFEDCNIIPFFLFLTGLFAWTI
jgi:hypothetical protein